MSFRHRIRTIYGKELVDILRDRRTLIAMIVVPIVLYPLLLLGSIQAVSYQTEKFVEEQIIIGVVNEAQGQSLDRLIRADAAALRKEKDQLGPESEEAGQLSAPLEKYDIRNLGSTSELEARVPDRSIHLGVLFDRDIVVDSADITNQVKFYYDKEDVRSQSARRALDDIFRRTADRARSERKSQAGLPSTFDQPFSLTSIDLSAPESILGQILPLILILMTITGAIYPAIDLTAGERERGTLESLMVCPVSVFDLIVGKFLVVTTVAIMGAALNLGSVAATVYFGGFDQVIARTGGGLPIGTMILILLCLIPFAVLMSAIMIAVCSYARTFKEAQNYVTPVILAVLIPGGIAALPATRLEGVMPVMPVGNMVLLARELLLGTSVPAVNVILVLLSTTLYAAAAVAIAANTFGRESVVFADSGSLRSSLDRSVFRPSFYPSISMSLLVVALLFPTWFFVQSGLSGSGEGDAAKVLYGTGWLMPLLFVLLPVFILWYGKVDIRSALALRVPSARYVVAAVLIGLSAWVPAHEVNVLQTRMFGVPHPLIQNAEQLMETLRALPIPSALVLIAIVPAICEEILFRGFLLNGLRGSARKWTGIVVSAAVFGVFHFFVFKFSVTVGLGVVLAYLCWQSQSIVPSIVTHGLHNAIGVLSVFYPAWHAWIGLSQETDASDASALTTHLPVHVVLIGCAITGLGIALAARAKAPSIEMRFSPKIVNSAGS